MPDEVTPMSEERLHAIERRNYAHQPIQPIDVDDLVKEIICLRSERDALEYARVCWLLKSKEVETLRDEIHSREVETGNLLQQKQRDFEKIEALASERDALKLRVQDLNAELADPLCPLCGSAWGDHTQPTCIACDGTGYAKTLYAKWTALASEVARFKAALVEVDAVWFKLMDMPPVRRGYKEWLQFETKMDLVRKLISPEPAKEPE